MTKPLIDPTIDVEATARLAAQACAELDALNHPNRAWVTSDRPGDDAGVADVVIIGGGQSGIIIAAALARETVENVRVLDQAAAGAEGPWTTYARMAELRTPKALIGAEFGLPSLSTRRWYEAAYGAGAWDTIERVPRIAWRAYLDWYADTMGVGIENGMPVTDIAPAADGLVAVTTPNEVIHARVVVLATGFDGAGSWTVPEVVTSALPSDRFDHSNGPIDVNALRGARLGVLGHGASAFDNAVAALEAGAESVDLFFRRARLPRVNPHRFLESAGLMGHYPDLSDATRWRIAHHLRTNDQPPPQLAFRRATAFPNFRLHPGSPWETVGLAAGTSGERPDIAVSTPTGTFRFDHLIAATGARTDLAARPELRSLAPLVATWAERYEPPDDLAHDDLARLPYLDAHYGLLPRDASDSWVNRVLAFNFASAVSHPPHSTSISGHRHSLPRVVRGITRRLMLDSEQRLVEDLLAYTSDDLDVGDDFESQLLENTPR